METRRTTVLHVDGKATTEYLPSLLGARSRARRRRSNGLPRIDAVRVALVLLVAVVRSASTLPSVGMAIGANTTQGSRISMLEERLLYE